MKQSKASEKKRELSLVTGDDTLSGSIEEDAPVINDQLDRQCLLKQPNRRGT
jgi:hypothetical protein